MAITTKFPLQFAAIGAALLTFAGGAFAQKVTVDRPKINIEIQKTPRYQVNGPKEKRDTQKFWLEVEVEFMADQKGGDPREEYIDNIEFKYFISIKPKTGGKAEVYTLAVNHVNIPKGEKIYSVVYMSPSTLGKIIGKSATANQSDIAVAVEIRHQGQLIAGDATRDPKSRWWNNMSQKEGLVLNKDQTPFAPLWSDRYAEVQGN